MIKWLFDVIILFRGIVALFVVELIALIFAATTENPVRWIAITLIAMFWTAYLFVEFYG